MKNYSIVGGVMEHPVTDGIMVDTTITADAYVAAAMITGAVETIHDYFMLNIDTRGWAVSVEVDGDYHGGVYICNYGDEIHIEDGASYEDYGCFPTYSAVKRFLVEWFETV